jgi:hypothetical protein
VRGRLLCEEKSLCCEVGGVVERTWEGGAGGGGGGGGDDVELALGLLCADVVDREERRRSGYGASMAEGCSVLGARHSWVEEDGERGRFRARGAPRMPCHGVDRFDLAPALSGLRPRYNLTLSKTVDRHFVIPSYIQ